jgi:hypothetical protein
MRRAALLAVVALAAQACVVDVETVETETVDLCPQSDCIEQPLSARITPTPCAEGFACITIAAVDPNPPDPHLSASTRGR